MLSKTELVVWMYRRLCSLKIFVCSLLLITTAWYYFYQTTAINYSWDVELSSELQSSMLTDYPGVVALSDMMTGRKYHLSHLPRRLKHVSFAEMTTSNPDTGHPLSPDFSFHIAYSKNRVTVFEDYGCGCIYRLYLLPPFSSFQERIDKLLPQDLKGLVMVIVLDEISSSYTLQQMMESRSLPFVYPMSSQNAKPMSGVGSYTPLCYQKSAKIFYENDNDYPSNILNMTVDCVSNELKCPVKQYSSVSFLKLPSGYKNPNFNIKLGNSEEHVKSLARSLEQPARNGPNTIVGCTLLCSQLTSGKSLVIYEKYGASLVITSVLLTVLNIQDESQVSHWKDIFLIAYFDGSVAPQLNISIESLFISQAYPNDFRGAGYGRLDRSCYYSRKGQRAKYNTFNVGYFYLPMPFWHDVKLMLQHVATPSYSEFNRLICYQVIRTSNLYNKALTGHLYGQQLFYSGETDKWREVLTVTKGWGHLVGLGVEIHHLRPNLEGDLIERWAALQADPFVYIDNLKTPKVRGTGLEDYFSYSHGFTGAFNTSYSFVGVPLGLVDRDGASTWICYRQQLLDPLIFDDSMQFVMEGTNNDLFMTRADPLSYLGFKERLGLRKTAFSYLSLYYYRAHSVVTPVDICDEIILSDEKSRSQHQFEAASDGTPFNIKHVRYIGDVKHSEPLQSVSGLSFPPETVIKFTLKVPFSNEPKLIFTRTFHMLPFQWNDKCYLKINDLQYDDWIFPMGPTTTEYTLRDSSVELAMPDLSVSDNSVELRFEITTLTPWRDISYRLCNVL